MTKPRTRKVRLRTGTATYPYEITCTSCETRLVAVTRDWLVLIGPRPIEVVGGLAGETSIVCTVCGNVVPLDRELVAVR